jgi:hypothetical protein
MTKVAQLTMVAAVAIAALAATAPAKADGPGANDLIGTWAADRVRANSEGIKDEKTAVGKILRPTGISVDAIKKHGIFGGSNSVFRKPFG